MSKDKNTSLGEPSPLSTRSLRSKYVRKPLSEYGKSSPSNKQVSIRDAVGGYFSDCRAVSPILYYCLYFKVDRDSEYTKLLPQENDNEISKDHQRSNQNSPFSSYHEGPKLSMIPCVEVCGNLFTVCREDLQYFSMGVHFCSLPSSHVCIYFHYIEQNEIIHNAMSPPIGSCKTSSPVNSTEIFDAPTSAIAGPVARSSRYHLKSSAHSHDESYISTSSERSTRVSNNKTVTQRRCHTQVPSIDLLGNDGTYQTNISNNNTDLSGARKRPKNIKRYTYISKAFL